MQFFAFKLRPLTRFAGLLCFAAILLFCTTRPIKSGDFVEYCLTTIAFATHGTPYVTLSDVEHAIALSSEEGYRGMFMVIREYMLAGHEAPMPGLLRSRHGHYLTLHFFAYPALAALPFRIFEAAGIDPFKAYQLVNYAPLLAVGLACRLLFGSGRRAGLALALFLLCGALRYLNWCSPEVFTTASLLAGLVLCTIGRPIAAAILAGVAAMQNPPLIAFGVFAPALRVGWLMAAEQLAPAAALRAVAGARTAVACALQLTLAIVPVLFSLWQFGEPSMIARLATDPALVSSERLRSFFFDPNQGAIVACPALILLLAWLLWQRRGQRPLWHLALVLGLTLALALPSLATGNWNSGAAGPMRYVVWGVAPLLYLALAWLAQQRRWPPLLLGTVLALQGAAMLHARSYHHLEFSPLGAWVLRTAPGWYDPDPELFLERVVHRDGAVREDGVIAYPNADRPLKTLYNARNREATLALCGPGRRLLDDDVVQMAQGWRYINGAPRCAAVNLDPGLRAEAPGGASGRPVVH